MNQTEILVIGRHEEILQTVLRLINKNPSWQATGTGDDETAIELFHLHSFDLVILGGGIEPESELKLRTIFRMQNPNIKIIQHWGGGSGLLACEIQSALADHKAGNFYIIDDAF